MKSASIVLACATAFGLAGCATEQTNETVQERVVPAGKVLVCGAVTKELMLDADVLSRMSPVTGEWKHRNDTRSFKGAPLWSILREAGLDPGPEGKDVPKAQKRAGLRKIVLVTARDGLQTTFSAAELWDENAVTQCYVCWEIDGKPLSEEEGPLRLVTPTDDRGIRSTFALSRIEVIDPAKKGP